MHSKNLWFVILFYFIECYIFTTQMNNTKTLFVNFKFFMLKEKLQVNWDLIKSPHFIKEVFIFSLIHLLSFNLK